MLGNETNARDDRGPWIIWEMPVNMKKTFKQVNFELDGEPWKIPYWEIDSERPGPCLLVCAALHGQEINGAESILRWTRELPETLLRGRVLALPFANLPAVRIGEQVELHELGKWQVWPGAADGNRKEQVYHALHDELAARATHAIDLHSYGECTAAEALTREDQPAGMELGLAAALPFTRIAAPVGGPQIVASFPGEKAPRCTLERLMTDSGRVAVSLELSGQLRLFPEQVKLGVECLRRMAAHLEMIAAPSAPAPGTTRIYSPRDNGRMVFVKAPGHGLFIAAGKKPGDRVRQGEVIAEWAPEESLEIEPLHAPVGGRLYTLGVHYEKAPASAASGAARNVQAGDQKAASPRSKQVAYPYAAPGAVLASIFPDQL